jgi:hypothetical protein
METVFISKQFSDIVCWRAIFVGKISFVGKLGLEVFWEDDVISPSRLVEPCAEIAGCFKCEIQHLRRRDLDDLFARRHSASDLAKWLCSYNNSLGASKTFGSKLNSHNCNSCVRLALKSSRLNAKQSIFISLTEKRRLTYCWSVISRELLWRCAYSFRQYDKIGELRRNLKTIFRQTRARAH